MKIKQLFLDNFEFGFTYNKFTFPHTIVLTLLLIPCIYFQELNVLAWYFIFPFVLLFIPIHDKGENQ